VLLGCLGDSPNVTFRFDPPPDVDVHEVTLVLLPVDIDHLVDSLSGQAPTPRPSFDEMTLRLGRLDNLMSPDLSSLEGEWGLLRRNVTTLADSLNGVSRASPGYAEAYARLRALYADLTVRERALEGRLRTLMDSEQASLARQATISSDSLRGWETDALSDLPNVIAEVANRTGRAGTSLEATVGDEVSRSLTSGPWWAVVRMRHPENRFLEYYWNVPFTVNRWVPTVVPLGQHNMVNRWRH